MLRYPRLYLYFLRFSFSKAMEFRLDFYFRVVMDGLFYAVNLAFFSILYRHVQSIGGWSHDQALVFVAGYFVVDALHMTVFANNMWALPTHVNRGDLDFYLVRPVSPLFFLSVRDFAANSFFNLALALGILAWTLARYPGDFTAGQIALYLLLIVNGTLIYWMIEMCFLIPVFWLHTNAGLRSIFFSITGYGMRPDPIFKGWIRRILTLALPFCLVASFPARLLLDAFDWTTLLHILAVTICLFFAMTAFWKRALRAYSSASS